MTNQFKHPDNMSASSSVVHHIAGITTYIHGLDQLPPASSTASLTCLFLLNPRLVTYEYMVPIALKTLNAHHASPVASSHGLITVCFDQRNHGARMVSALSNETWRTENPLHAQDMFSIYHGTSIDVSTLLDYLPAYIFPNDEYRISQNICAGVSLGGHATWLTLVHEPRVTSGVVVIGCPDYQRVMTHRAEKSRLDSWTGEDPESSFLGSKQFPTGLLHVLHRVDPAGFIYNSLKTDSERKQRLGKTLGGKKMLILSGGADKLVPYDSSKPFLDWLKTEKPILQDGKESSAVVNMRDVVYDGVGHECTEEMVQELITFVLDAIKNDVPSSKI